MMDNAVAESIGINGWCIIIRKTGSYINNMVQEVQIVLLAICHPDKIPTNTEEVNSLRYLKMMPINKQKCDYNAQILITKKREETQFGLKKLDAFRMQICPTIKQIQIQGLPCRYLVLKVKTVVCIMK